jgi:hypothetical protein
VKFHRYGVVVLILGTIVPFLASTSSRPSTEVDRAVDDTLVSYLYPYYRVVQVYDSVSISCWFGEAVIRRTDNTSKTMSLADWNSELHSPLCMTTLDSLALVSKTRPVLGSPGDTITYYKDLIINLAHGWMTGDFAPTDQIRFVTELIDSTSGNVIAYMDTMGVRSFNDRYTADTSAFGSLESTHFFILPSFESTGFLYEKVFIRIRSIFDGNSNDEVICRWDTFSTEKMSLISNEFATNLASLMDSLIDAGFLNKQPQGAEPQYRYSATVQYKAGDDVALLSIFSPTQDVITVNVYNSLGQNVFCRQGVALQVGQTNLEIYLRVRPSGTYYTVGSSPREIVFVKRFTYLPYGDER